MRPGTAKYTPQERDVVAALILDEGRTAPEVAHLAGHGEAGVPSFVIQPATVYTIARRERQRRERERRDSLTLDEMSNDTLRQLLELVGRDVERLQTQARSEGRLDHDQARGLLRVLQTLIGRPALRAIALGTHGVSTGNAETPDEPTLFERLLAGVPADDTDV